MDTKKSVIQQKIKYWYAFVKKLNELKYELKEIEKQKKSFEKQIINDLSQSKMNNYQFEINKSIIAVKNRVITQSISKEYIFEKALRYFNSKTEAEKFVRYVYSNREKKTKKYLHLKKKINNK